MTVDKRTVRQPEWRVALGEFLLAGIVLVFAAVLLVLSARSGVERFQHGTALLSKVATSAVQLRSSVLQAMNSARGDYDAITMAQHRLRTDIQNYREFLADETPANLERLGKDAIDNADNFKSEHAIVRNSQAIASEMLHVLIERPDTGASIARDTLLEIERKWLKFAATRDDSDMLDLAEEIQSVSTSVADVATPAEWLMFVSHVDQVAKRLERLQAFANSVLDARIEAELAERHAELASQYRATRSKARLYKVVLFVLIVGLLGFCIYKVVEVASFVRALNEARNLLETRVEERTGELEDSNRALQQQIEERQQVESELRMAQKLESIGQLAAGVAHEINTPTQYVSDNVGFVTDSWNALLPVLLQYESALRDGKFDPEQARAAWKEADVEFLREDVPAALREAAAGLAQIANIVRAMKEFSHPGEDDLRPVDINHAIENIVTVARNEWKYVADVALDFAPDMPPVPCNLSAMNQVFLNIVVNAAQAVAGQASNGEKGNIRISTRCLDDRARIVIEDDGPGIPESIRSKVFDPFFTTKDVGKGTGQGLAIAYRVVVTQHEGTIAVSPGEDGRGARFTIELPLRTQPESNEQHAANTELPAPRASAVAGVVG